MRVFVTKCDIPSATSRKCEDEGKEKRTGYENY